MTTYQVEVVANEEPLFTSHRRAQLTAWNDDEYLATYKVRADSPLDAVRFLSERLPEMDRDQVVSASASWTCWFYELCPETGKWKEWR